MHVKNRGGIQDIICYYTMLHSKRSNKVKAGRLIQNLRGVHHARMKRNIVKEKKLLLHGSVVQELKINENKKGGRQKE